MRGILVSNFISKSEKLTIVVKVIRCKTSSNKGSDNIEIAFNFLRSNPFMLTHFNYGREYGLTLNHEFSDSQ